MFIKNKQKLRLYPINIIPKSLMVYEPDQDNACVGIGNVLQIVAISPLLLSVKRKINFKWR
jgi:hypothetical protein